MGRDRARKASGRNSVTVMGLWFPMPLEFLLSRVCASLSPHAVKMFIDLCSQLKANGYGNGDLSAAPAVMRPRGWTSNTTRLAALAELVEVGVLSVTRQGGRRNCSLYAITLWPIQCSLDKLDHGPGSYTQQDWRRALNGAPERVNADNPAQWAKTRRKNALACPDAGQPPSGLNPLRDNPAPAAQPFEPAAGSKQPNFSADLVPPRDTFLETPSAALLKGRRRASAGKSQTAATEERLP